MVSQLCHRQLHAAGAGQAGGLSLVLPPSQRQSHASGAGQARGLSLVWQQGQRQSHAAGAGQAKCTSRGNTGKNHPSLLVLLCLEAVKNGDILQISPLR